MEKLTIWLGLEKTAAYYNSEISSLKTVSGKIKRLQKYLSDWHELRNGIVQALESIELHKMC